MAQNDPGRSVMDSDEYNEHFMRIAFVASLLSNDPKCKVGACIVNDERKIVGIGYNAMPGYLDNKFTFQKDKRNPLNDKLTYICHAELNAIANKMCCSIKNCTIYVTRSPCNECAKLIVQHGIKCVVYMTDKHKNKWDSIAAREMFKKCGVEYKQCSVQFDAFTTILDKSKPKEND